MSGRARSCPDFQLARSNNGEAGSGTAWTRFIDTQTKDNIEIDPRVTGSVSGAAGGAATTQGIFDCPLTGGAARSRSDVGDLPYRMSRSKGQSFYHTAQPKRGIFDRGRIAKANRPSALMAGGIEHRKIARLVEEGSSATRSGHSSAH